MQLVKSGYFSKTHGVKGQLIFIPEIDFDETKVKACFIESATGKAPYFIKDLKYSADSFIVLLEEINSVEEAKKLIGKSVYLDAAFVIEQEEVENWRGFELIEQSKGSLGEITDQSDNGSQLILILNYQGKEVLLPLVDDFVESIDEANKKLFYKAPEGLIDMYLNEAE